ncbi:MAG: flavin reductase family protein [Calditrichaeota bacterium]|nr:MAG: flavin reductase family protein [Calditrichota bacterium]
MKVQKFLAGGIAPRPIALVSTIAADGTGNLSPFSYFNTFGANPPMVGFSALRRVRDGSTKDTLNNVQATRECVIHAVSYAMVQQTSLSSTEYDSSVDEFQKSGFTAVNSDVVKPKRVLESPFHMECIVKQIIPLGNDGGSGNLVLCEVVKFHIDKSIFNSDVIEPQLIDLVGRNSANYYTRASGTAVFEVEKPRAKKGIGVDQLPSEIRNSHILSANNLGQLGNIENLPTETEIKHFLDTFEDNNASESISEDCKYFTIFRAALSFVNSDSNKVDELIETAAQIALENKDTDFAIKALCAGINLIRQKAE